jgi:hypothetical protein
MVVEIGLAVVFALLLGVIAHPYSEYDFYVSWVRIRRWLIYFVPYLVLNGLSGWLGWFAVQRIHWHAGDQVVLRALADALVGQALVRVELNKLPLEGADDPVNILGKATGWFRGMLLTWVKNEATGLMAWLEPRPFSAYCMALLRDGISKDDDYSREIQKFLGDTLTTRIAELGSNDADIVRGARIELEPQAVDWILKYRYRAPILVPRSPAS